MKNLLLSLFYLMSTVVLIASCCPKNPSLYSVKTAHGNTDWHIDTAEEFLTGQDMAGNPSAANHCPDTWIKTHMHVGLVNTNNYYYDKDVTVTGNDNDPSSGVDKPMLFFYAGHGSPTSFNTLGNSASLTHMRLGNCNGSNDGTLRYYWQCSCEVFAHGPSTCSGTTHAYACPEDFDGSADSAAMRNVYERWGVILDPSLRMACGSSTSAYCHETETNKIWDNYNNKGYDVADSFIYGLHRYSWNTPLCITTGGLFTSTTPLYDSIFTNAPNPSGAYFHIQYLSNFDTTAPPVLVAEIPDLIPVYELKIPPLPDPYKKMRFEEKGEWMYSTDILKKRGVPVVRANNNSGSVYFSGERIAGDKARPLEEKEYLRLARRFIEEQGWTEKEVSAPAGVRMMTQPASREGKKPVEKNTQKNVIVTFRRTVSIAGKTVPMIGEGGVVSVQLNNDGSVLNASKVWRQIQMVLRTTKAKKYEQAYKEAIAKIQESEAYTLSDWTWGYEEAAANVRQTEMKAVYVFNFMPVDPKMAERYPPRIVKISAHMEEGS